MRNTTLKAAREQEADWTCRTCLEEIRAKDQYVVFFRDYRMGAVLRRLPLRHHKLCLAQSYPAAGPALYEIVDAYFADPSGKDGISRATVIQETK